MKHLATLLSMLSLCSCSGFTESSALKITEESNSQALYLPIQTGKYFAVADSDYVCIGFNKIRPADDHLTYESTHRIDWNIDTPELELADGNGATVFFNASSASLSFLNYTSRCSGCAKCLDEYARKGLLTVETLSEGTNNLVNVALTDEGAQYSLNNPNGLSILNEENYTDVKLAEKKFCKAEKVFENERRADFFVSYYLAYTPWAEALGYTTNEANLETIRVTFTKNNNDEWKISETENIKRNG